MRVQKSRLNGRYRKEEPMFGRFVFLCFCAAVFWLVIKHKINANRRRLAEENSHLPEMVRMGIISESEAEVILKGEF